MKININFSSYGFAKIFSKEEVLSSATPNKEAILNLSDALTENQVFIPPGDAVGFKSIPDLIGNEYVGYIIEKERFNPANHEWVRTDEYNLIGSRTNVFRDTRIAYGYTYRYRMRSVMKVTVKQEVDFISYYYESSPSKDWDIVDVVKLTPPNYPQTIKIFPNSVKKEVIISWLRPVSIPSVDLDVPTPMFFNVYRRNNVGEPWTVIFEGLEQFETLVVDKNVDFNKKYIYAISSIDGHGIESYLSTQVQVQLNPNIAIEKKEKDLVWVSGGGTSKEEIGLILKKFYQRKEQLIARNNIVLKPNTRFREEGKDFLIKIRSLDTHEKYELKTTLKNQKVQR